MVHASKQRVPQLKSDQAAIDLKPPKLSGIGKLRKARNKAYSSKDPGSDQYSSKVLKSDQYSSKVLKSDQYSSKDPKSDQYSVKDPASDQFSLTIADVPAPESRSEEPGPVARLALLLSMSALVVLVATLVVMVLMPRQSV
jgi:hypothetical protein